MLQKTTYNNLDHVKMSMNKEKFFGILKSHFFKNNGRPDFILPRKPLNIKQFEYKESLVWLGHSTILLRINGVTLIVDPMLSQRASPLSWVGPKRFEGSMISYDELPMIDLVVITHNHYDHLDKTTLQSIHKNVKRFFIPKGNRSILQQWGIDPEKIVEFTWFESQNFENIEFVFCPTQHFSGRTLTDRDRSLWGSWVIKTQTRNLYISGDSGYHHHFKTIGDLYGPFDIACIECGAYNDHWQEVHMTPEQSVQAAIDLRTKIMMPIHWGGFDLSTHPWDEPITRALQKAYDVNLPLTTPMIGEILSFEDLIKNDQWWLKT